jgi:hypothetical protein
VISKTIGGHVDRRRRVADAPGPPGLSWTGSPATRAAGGLKALGCGGGLESQRALLSGDRWVPGPTGRVGPGNGLQAANGPPPEAARTPGERGYRAARAAGARRAGWPQHTTPRRLDPGRAQAGPRTPPLGSAQPGAKTVSLCHRQTCGRRFSQDLRRESAKSLRFKGLKQPGRSSREGPPPGTRYSPPHLKTGFSVRRISEFRFFQISDFQFCISGGAR